MMYNKILIFIDWFLPGYKAGGPIKSVNSIISELSVFFKFYVVTGDRDLGDESSYKDVVLNNWIQKEKYNIIYLTKDKQTKKTYRKLIEEIKPNTIYFNSLFSYKFTILPLITVKLYRKHSIKKIIAPRGMFGEGAMKIKYRKKVFFLYLCKLIGFFENVIWHASSDYEKKDIIENINANSIVKIAPNLSRKITEEWTYKEKKRGELNLFFLSRISKTKNLHYALKILQSIKEERINFYVIGTKEDVFYFNKCMNDVDKLTNNIKFYYLGEVENTKIHNIISKFHFLFLPTLHENFGHVIAESLQAGCPVIISDQTIWRDLEQKGVGWDISLENEVKFIDVIKYCSKMTSEEYNNMSKEAFEYAKKSINSVEIIEQNRMVFE